MDGIWDTHCHLLPGVDDGPETMEDTLSTLREAERQHIEGIIVTPHFHPGRYMVYASQIYSLLESVREECRRNNIHITLYPGQECYYYSGLVEQLNSKKVLTLADSRYVLVEFEPDCPYSQMQFGVRELQSNGYHPILAHFERYRCLYDKDKLYEMKQRGALLQMNFDTLLKHEGLFRKLPWKDMVQQGLVDYFGSDCHGMDFRPLRADKAVKWMREELPKGLFGKMLHTNVQLLLNND